MDKVRIWVGRTDEVRVHPTVYERRLEPPAATWRPCWGRVLAWSVVLVVGLGLLTRCATVQTPAGPVRVVKLPQAVCERIAAELQADYVAWTVGHPIMCGSAAAAQPCLVLHEQTHAKEQAAYPGGLAAWITDWLADWRTCRRQLSASECHEAHPLEQAAIAEQRRCEAGALCSDCDIAGTAPYQALLPVDEAACRRGCL